MLKYRSDNEHSFHSTVVVNIQFESNDIELFCCGQNSFFMAAKSKTYLPQRTKRQVFKESTRPKLPGLIAEDTFQHVGVLIMPFYIVANF